MKVLSVVGARPEFIQAMPLSRELRRCHHEVLVHTGQHYDYLMSQVFFQELAIPCPDYNLQVGSGTHGRQTSEMLGRLEEVMALERPDWVVVRGDTNSTLAGALAAAKLCLPLAHVEAGARSFDRTMPEEVNRVVADHVADLLLCIAPSAVRNLAAEGLSKGVHYVGDVMYDALLQCLPLTEQRPSALRRFDVAPQRYLLATAHRAANVDSPQRLASIVSALNSLCEPIVFPVHPRTGQALARLGFSFGDHVRLAEPVGYLDMLTLERNARLILTDSGGVTREAFMLGVPCLTLREETEHVETVECGWNLLVGVDPEVIVNAVREFHPRGDRPAVFGNGTAAKRIVELMADARR